MLAAPSAGVHRSSFTSDCSRGIFDPVPPSQDVWGGRPQVVFNRSGAGRGGVGFGGVPNLQAEELTGFQSRILLLDDLTWLLIAGESWGGGVT